VKRINKNEKTMLFYIYKIGIVQRELIESIYGQSLNGDTKHILDKLLMNNILIENNIEGAPHLAISRDFDPIIRKEYENNIFRWTRNTKEIISLINSSMSRKP